MIKIGAHIKPIASATTLHIPYSLHSTPIKEAKHGNLSISECQDTESGREANPGRWIGNPRFNQWAIDPDAECKVKRSFKRSFKKCNVSWNSKNSNTRGRSKITELKKVVIQMKPLNPKR